MVPLLILSFLTAVKVGNSAWFLQTFPFRKVSRHAGILVTIILADCIFICMILTMLKSTLDAELKKGWMVKRSFTIREDQAHDLADLKADVNWSAVVRNALDAKLAKLKQDKD